MSAGCLNHLINFLISSKGGASPRLWLIFGSLTPSQLWKLFSHRPLFKMRIALYIEFADAVTDGVQSKPVVDVVHRLMHALESRVFLEK